ncbi:MAG: hypothetical protein IJD40_09230 [Lachnospiraceae bacterium]|nr:hypothetical protein [Lachnospiraceae bacterium]
MYRVLGYYICEKLKIPDFLGIEADEIITVSDCFSGTHPDLTYCYFINDRKREKIEYYKKWDITEAKAFLLQNDIHFMFERCLAIDGRFSNIEDAKRIRQKYYAGLRYFGMGF